MGWELKKKKVEIKGGAEGEGVAAGDNCCTRGETMGDTDKRE
jgi:hypothetical protein